MVPHTKDIGVQFFRHNLVHARERFIFLVPLVPSEQG